MEKLELFLQRKYSKRSKEDIVNEDILGQYHSHHAIEQETRLLDEKNKIAKHSRHRGVGMGSVKVSVSLQDELLAAIDMIAKKESRSRSELLREAARLYVERQQRWKDIFSFAQNLAREKGLTEKT